MATSKVKSAKKASTSDVASASTQIQKAAQPKFDAESLTAAPVVYADSLIQIGLGAFVSKCTFGTQQSQSASVSAILTLVLPTNAMIDLAKHILAVASAPGQEEKISSTYTGFQANLKTLTKL